MSKKSVRRQLTEEAESLAGFLDVEDPADIELVTLSLRKAYLLGQVNAVNILMDLIKNNKEKIMR